MPLILQLLRNGNLILASLHQDQEYASAAQLLVDPGHAVTDDSIEQLCHTLTQASGNLVNLQRAGSRLWSALLPSKAAQQLRDTTEHDLVLILDESLVQIPWELLFDGQRFLAERFQVGRIVRSQQPRWTLPHRVVHKPVTVMILADPAGDSPEAQREGILLHDALRQSSDLAASFRTGPLAPYELAASDVFNHDFLFYCGQFRFMPGNPTETGWVLVDQTLFSVRDLEDQATRLNVTFPKLIVSHAHQVVGEGTWSDVYQNNPQARQELRDILLERLSESELKDLCFYSLKNVNYENLGGSGKHDKVRELIAGLERQRRLPELVALIHQLRPDVQWSYRWNTAQANSHIANAFLRAGTTAYIDTGWMSWGSESAVSFATTLCTKLVQDRQTLGQTVLETRQALQRAYGLEQLDWTSGVLYGDPLLTLYGAEPAAERGAQDADLAEMQNLWVKAIASENQGQGDKAREYYNALNMLALRIQQPEMREAVQSRLATLDQTIHANQQAAQEVKKLGRQAAAVLTQIGPYHLTDKIGFGQYKTMYRADNYNENIAAPLVALGIPHLQEKEHTQGKVDAFQRLSLLNHPHLVRVLDSAESLNLFYIVYEYVEGAQTLEQKLNDYAARGERLPIERAMAYALQICEALDYAHSRGVWHGDLNPANVLIDAEDNTKVKDIGLAALRGMVDNPRVHYAAPEQIFYNARRPSVDVWAVGVLLYQMLTGQLPFGKLSETSYEVALRIRTQQPVSPALLNPAISWELAGIVMKALDRQQRYETCGELARDLRRLAEGKPLIVPLEENLRLHLRAAYALLALLTKDEQRGLEILDRVGTQLGIPVYKWTAFAGLTTGQTRLALPADEVLSWFAQRPEKAILVLSDFSPYLTDEVVRSQLNSLYYRLQRRRPCAIVLLTAQLSLPSELEKKCAFFTLEPPDVDAIRSLVQHEQEQVQRQNLPVTMSEVDLQDFAWQAHGLDADDIARIVHKSVVKRGGLSPEFKQDLFEAKREVVNRSGLVEFRQPDITFDDIGGADILRDHVRTMGIALRAGNWLPLPKGWLLLGVPGCGKSLAAKAIAGEWQIPLLCFDLARIYGSYLGEAESNMLEVLRIAEHISPVVLWIDEIEKGLAGSQSEGAGGTMSRVYGMLLSWLQERTAPVFVVATANTLLLRSPSESADGTRSIASQLPVTPELFRAGRFDEVFFFDVPTPAELAEILTLFLKKYDCRPADVDLAALVEAAHEATPVEIEQAIVSLLFHAQAAGETTLRQQDLVEALRLATRVAHTQRDDIVALYGLAQEVGALRTAPPEVDR